MLTSQRRQLILQILADKGEVLVQDLAQKWAVSEDSIRRDLRDLASEGKLQRVHGGALPSSPATGVFATRVSISTDSKTRLGRFGASLVENGQVVAIDGGTTNIQLVRNLPLDLRATIVTHSPHIAVELINHTKIDLILIGGSVFKHSMVALGAKAIDDIGKIHTDLFFMGATGIHPKKGATTGSFEEALIKAAFVHSSAEVVLLASPEKINAVSPFEIVQASEIDLLITDGPLDHALGSKFEKQGMRLVYRDQ